MTKYGKMKGSDILGLSGGEISKMNERELAEATSVLARIANKRINTMVQQGITSPAMRQLNNNLHFETKGKDYKSLQQEFKRVSNYLTSGTSSVSEYRKVLKNISNKLNLDVSVKKGQFSQEQWDKLWQIYHKAEEKNAVALSGIGYKEVISMAADMVNQFSGDTDEATEQLIERLEGYYEQDIEAYDEEIGDMFGDSLGGNL